MGKVVDARQSVRTECDSRDGLASTFSAAEHSRARSGDTVVTKDQFRPARQSNAIPDGIQRNFSLPLPEYSCEGPTTTSRVRRRPGSGTGC